MKVNEAELNKKDAVKYDPAVIEKYWREKWEDEGIFQPSFAPDGARVDKPGSKPFFNLMMFPYPSAEGLHAGNTFAFCGVDIYGRFKRMQGNDVFEPIGLDGFGIHSENHAIKTGTHPMEHAERTEKNFYRQLRSIGNGFAWKNKVETYDPGYYKWTQWLFIQLFKAGLAYRKKSPVNYCPSCMTVLADEQVIEGKCERCVSVVEKRELEQWFFRITKYAERLDGNIGKLNWSEKVKVAQKNWIGKKTGINIRYRILVNEKGYIEVFTTRPDTNFGATFVALAPDSEVAQKILGLIKDEGILRKIKDYIELVKNKSEIERLAEGREKTGVSTGLYAVNELTGREMPIWISDFVLGGFGTGALVGVPGHDRRDFEFAEKFGLEIKRVVVGKDGDSSDITRIEQVQEDEGTMINSGFLNGLEIHQATEKIMDYMEKKGYGRRETTYRLRDWLISRQRYWGPPIPMIHCEKCGWQPVPEDQLPVKLPYIKDFKPMGTDKSPLANYPDFHETVCPKCGGKARRETDVSDTFLDSSWYFLRYLSADWDDMPFPSEKLAKSKMQKALCRERARFLPVKMYIGGAEHSVLHLMYARFVTMVLADLGYLDFEEPFSRFYAHGLIIKDGAKMSKSKGNVVNPDEYIRKFGADTLRMYLHFLGPLNEDGDFRDTGIEGMYRFLKRVWKLFSENVKNQGFSKENSDEGLRMMHGTIAGVTEDLENLRYNTAIAKLMTWYNFLAKRESLSLQEAENYLKLLAPFAPHLSEELSQQFLKIKSQNRKFESIHLQDWPSYDPKYLEEDLVTIAVQVNGKMRGTIKDQRLEIKDQGDAERLVKESGIVKRYLEDKQITRVIYVPGKVINFVVR